MGAVDTVLSGKSLEDLQDVAPEVAATKPSLTQAKVEEVLKYLKFQNGTVGNTEGNEDYIGKGDGQICSLVDITKDQLKEVKVALSAKITELTPCLTCEKAPCECPEPEPEVPE